MLGGSVFIALIRFAISLAGSMLLFSILGQTRFGRKKTVVYYSCFGAVLTALACVWYVLDWSSCVRMVAFVMYLCFMVFSIIISGDSIYMTIYKLALVFYLMSVFVIGGLEVSILFFNRNVWADIVTRVLLIALIAFLIDVFLKKSIKGFSEYVENEADKFSVVVMIICILFGIGYILNPSSVKEAPPHRLYQILTNFFLTGVLQLLVFRFYLHVGKEKEYERENQLMQMNNRLLERHLEVLKESVDSGRRLRHDIRHHNAVIAEYARREQKEELLRYLSEYDRETEEGVPEMICSNAAVNSILSAYTRKARDEQIRVELDVALGKNLSIPSIDLVAILANAYENAIYACKEVKKYSAGRDCFIRLRLQKKKNKLLITCSNTCKFEAEMADGKPKTEFTGGVGVSSIIKTAEKYNGKYDFKNDNGVFVFRLVMDIEPMKKGLADGGKYDVSDSAR